MAHIKFPMSRVDAMHVEKGLVEECSWRATLEVPIMARIAVTDGMAKAAISVLEKAGHEVVVGHIEKKDLLDGALKDFDAIIVRSATKLPEAVIKESSGYLLSEEQE